MLGLTAVSASMVVAPLALATPALAMKQTLYPWTCIGLHRPEDNISKYEFFEITNDSQLGRNVSQVWFNYAKSHTHTTRSDEFLWYAMKRDDNKAATPVSQRGTQRLDEIMGVLRAGITVYCDVSNLIT